MPDALTFARLPDAPGETVTIHFNGTPVEARAGDTVAAALVAAGHATLRETPVSAAPRGPFCMMGACFDCLVEIDGEPNCQACMTPVRDGLQVNAMHGARKISGGGNG